MIHAKYNKCIAYIINLVDARMNANYKCWYNKNHHRSCIKESTCAAKLNAFTLARKAIRMRTRNQCIERAATSEIRL